MKKFALFVYNGDPMCFIHVLLNALDMHEKGHEARIIMEGGAVKLVTVLDDPEHRLFALWKKALDANLLEGVCQACAHTLGTLEATKERKYPLLNEMAGHPAILTWREKGYEVITF